MTRKSQKVDRHALHIDGQRPGRLGGINTEHNPMIPCDPSQLDKGLDRSRHVRGMGHDDQTGLRPNGGTDIIGIEQAVTRAGNHGKLHPLRLQKAQGPHDGIMFHARRNDVVARLKKPRQTDIQRLRGIPGKDDPEGVASEELRQSLPGFQDDPPRIEGAMMTGTAGIAADHRVVANHRLDHLRGLRPGGRGIIEIEDRICSRLRLYCLIHAHRKTIFSQFTLP